MTFQWSLCHLVSCIIDLSDQDMLVKVKGLKQISQNPVIEMQQVNIDSDSFTLTA